MSGKKRAAGNGITLQQSQVRQGSSFWTCPACNIAVHTALMAFHISSCPVVAANEVASPLKNTTKTLLPCSRKRIDVDKREEQETRQSSPLGSPDFSNAMKQSLSIMGEDVLQEEQHLTGRVPSFSLLSVDVGTEGAKLFTCPHPETPILEGRYRIGIDVERTVSPSSPPAEVRKRLFEDWGDQLSPEQPEDSAFPNEAVTSPGSPSLMNPQTKRSRIMESDMDESRIVVDLRLESDSTAGDVAEGKILHYVDSVHDSQQERHEEADSIDCTEKCTHENIPECDQKLPPYNFRSLELRADFEYENKIGRMDDGFSLRESQLENVIRELKEKYSLALLRETKLQENVDRKDKECERLRRREQELESELLSVRRQLENTLQELRDIVDGGEQILANEIHRPDQSATQVYLEDQSMATQLLSQTSNTPASRSNSAGATEQATQLLSDGLTSPDMDEGENSQASADFRRVSCSLAGPSDIESGEAFSSLEAALGKVDEFLAQRSIVGTETNKICFLSRSMQGAAAPHTPGKARLKPTGEQEEKDAYGGLNSCNLHANQRTDVTPGGGPKTPENFAVMLLKGQERGLICEMLNSFPPAQGTTHVAVDPFDEHYVGNVNGSASNVRNDSSFDGQRIISDVDDDKIRLRHEKLDECQPPASSLASENSKEEISGEIAWKKKRRKPALVVDSDSDEDIGKRANPTVENLENRHLFSCPPVNVILLSDEEDFCEASGGSDTKGKRRRLVRVQESPHRTQSFQPNLDSGGTKETRGEEFNRGSERMRNTGRREGLGSSGRGSRMKPDDEIVEIDSDSSDSRLTGSLQKPRKDVAIQRHRYSGAQRALFVSKEDVEDEEVDDIESDDSGFINDDPESGADLVDEISDSGQDSEADVSSHRRGLSEGRKKYNWDLEGDMLAALGKDTELCLRGLCAIYRRQEEDEKFLASSKYRNKRGFSTFHSARASMVASFLMGGAHIGPVVKSVKELKEEWDEATVTYCSDMCNHYSKQLFEIYVNKEDPYFPETGPIM